MNKNSKKIDLLLALAINVLFFIIYICNFELVHESNDDLAISFFVEGAYGARTEYLIYQNVLWGKFLVWIYQLAPQFKWYNILLYAGMFSSYLGISYTFLRTMGRKIGSLVNMIVLLFVGYQTYVVFQYSRVATLATAAGMLLLFLAVEHADSKWEKRIAVIAGAILALWGSMLRFQMFAMTVVLVAGAVVIYKAFVLIKEKRTNLLKELGAYIVVFGMVGVLSVGLYVVDRLHYSLNPEWKAFTEFNDVRTELWDYGFPDYIENSDVYESVDISMNDCWFYLCWNMDSELITTEKLQVIADAKEAKTFSIGDFFEAYPSSFIKMNLFVLYIVVSIFAIGLNRKNIYFALYGFLGVMAFEAYFFWAGRHGIQRVDYSMWMAVVIGLFYAISGDLKLLKDKAWKYIIAAAAAVLMINASDFDSVERNTTGLLADGSKIFYSPMMSDDEHLYVVLCGPPSVYFSYDFWEPAQMGDLVNVYNAYGWEWATEVRQDVLEQWDMTNVYRDGINNEKVYFIVGGLQDTFQNYIRENYDPNAQLVLERTIFDMQVFSLRSY